MHGSTCLGAFAPVQNACTSPPCTIPCTDAGRDAGFTLLNDDSLNGPRIRFRGFCSRGRYETFSPFRLPFRHTGLCCCAGGCADSAWLTWAGKAEFARCGAA